MIVKKFGGFSLANPKLITEVEKIVRSDEETVAVVVSAPGIDDQIQYKVTDLLLRIAGEMNDENRNLSADNARVLLKRRFSMICQGFDLSDLEKEIILEIDSLHGSRDYIASRGENFQGRIMSRVLDLPFFDAADFIRHDEKKIDKRLQALKGKSLVFPGFYGSSKGEIFTFERDGSDRSGSILARALKASLYENWKDVDGLYYASPKIVSRPKTILELSYIELRELTYMGFNAFHDEAIFPLVESGIPLRIKNTKNPSNPGTLISPTQHRDSSIPIAGIAAKPGFVYIEIQKYLMNKQTGFGERVLNILAKHDLSYEHAPSGIDNIAVVLENTEHFKEVQDHVIETIQRKLRPDHLEVHNGLALIAVVGENMRHTPGIMSRVSSSLARSNINIEIINQGPSENNVILGVRESDYQSGVRALYSEFVENGGASLKC